MGRYCESTIESVVASARSILEGFGRDAGRWRALADEGTSLGDLLKVSAQECAEFHAIARALYDSGDYERAVQVAVCTVAFDPGKASHAHLAGLCLLKLRQFEIAAAMFQAALEIDGTFADCALRLGECLRSLGKTQ